MNYHLHKNRNPSVLAFFPNTRGVGYSFFQTNKKHYLSEMITARKRFDNEKYFKRMKEKIEEFNPQILVLEEYRKSKGSVKTERIQSLIKKIAEYSKKQNVEVCFYTRKHIRDVFSVYNVMTKYDIAKLICLWIPWLDYHMYKPRSGQRMEPYSSALFEAVSLVVTCFYLNE